MTKQIFLRHPDSRLQFAWNLSELGLLIFLFSPLLGILSFLWVLQITWRQQFQSIINRPLNKGFAILTLILIVSVIFAHDKQTAALGLPNFLPYFLVLAGFSSLFQTINQLRRIGWILVIASIPIVIIGLGQLFLGLDLKIRFLWIVVEWFTPAGGNPPGRMSSIFMYANTLAGYFVIVFILSLGLWLDKWRQVKNLKSSSVLFLTLAVLLDFAGLILTNSRNAWVIAIIACFAYAVYQGWRLIVAGVTFVATSVTLAAFAPLPVASIFRKFIPAFFWARLNDQMYSDRPIAMMRTTQWEFAWSLTQERPWTGWGLRNFTQLYEAKMNIWLGHPHNFFLMLAAETGLPATILFTSLLAWILIAGVKLLLTSKNIDKEDKLIFFSYLLVFASLILFNTVDVSIYDVRLNTLWWLLLSAICGVIYRY